MTLDLITPLMNSLSLVRLGRFLLICFFLFDIMFLVVLSRQIQLMSSLFKSQYDFLLKLTNYFLLGFAVLGVLLTIFAP